MSSTSYFYMDGGSRFGLKTCGLKLCSRWKLKAEALLTVEIGARVEGLSLEAQCCPLLSAHSGSWRLELNAHESRLNFEAWRLVVVACYCSRLKAGSAHDWRLTVGSLLSHEPQSTAQFELVTQLWSLLIAHGLDSGVCRLLTGMYIDDWSL